MRSFRGSAGLVCVAAGLALCSCAHAPVAEEGLRLELGADLHAHLTMHAALPLLGDPSLTRAPGSAGDQLAPMFTAEGYWRAGVKVVLAALWVPPPRPGRTPWDELRAQVERLADFCRAHPRFALVRTVAEARRAISQERVAVFASVEGADAVAGPQDVDRLLALGVRSASFAHFVDTALVDAEDGQLGGLLRPFTDGPAEGLSPLGRAVVERAIARGLLVDVTHASPRATDELLALHRARGAPLLASHVGSGMSAPRTLTDAQALALRALGGLIGVGVFRHPLLQPVPDADRFPGFAVGTCDEAVAHQRHLARLVGEDGVLLGSDLGAPILRGGPGGSCPNGVRGDVDLPALLRAFVAQGAPAAALGQSGERLLELLEAAERRRTEPDA